MQAQTQIRRPGRPTLTIAGPCIRDGYTIDKALLRKFQAKCRKHNINKSKLLRDWIEWFLEQEIGEQP